MDIKDTTIETLKKIIADLKINTNTCVHCGWIDVVDDDFRRWYDCPQSYDKVCIECHLAGEHEPVSKDNIINNLANILVKYYDS